MCDRSSDPTEHDAARERPSALDVGSLSDFMAFVEREAGGLPYNLDHWLRLYFARLTEPDAGPDTTEATLRAYPRQEDFERALAEGLDTSFVADIIDPLESGEITLIARHLAIRCALLVRDHRAALQQPAVQLEGGPE